MISFLPIRISDYPEVTWTRVHTITSVVSGAGHQGIQRWQFGLGKSRGLKSLRQLDKQLKAKSCCLSKGESWWVYPARDTCHTRQPET